MTPHRLRRPASWSPALVFLALCGCGDGGSGNAAAVGMDQTITSDHCVVTIGFDQQAVIDIGDITLDYSDVDGNFGEPRYQARCRNLIDGATRSESYNRCGTNCDPGTHRELYLTFAMGEGQDDVVLDTPADMFECLFEGDGTTLSKLKGWNNFSGPQFADVPSGPVSVKVECDGWPASTTTTTLATTTTLPCGGDGCSPGDIISIRFWLDDPRNFGALQFNVDFPSAVGAFDQYSTPAARCTLAPGVNALFATNQTPRFDDPTCVDCQRRLAAAFAFGDGYTGPGLLFTCDFRIGDRVPTATDFALGIVDATTPSGDPLDPPVSVSLLGLPQD